MENNDPYEELEIYLKQINVSIHTIVGIAFLLLPIKREEISFSFFSFPHFCVVVFFLHANWSPFLPIAKTHNNAAVQKLISATEWIQFHSWSKRDSKANILLWPFFFSFSYFNHDRLIEPVVLLSLLRAGAPTEQHMKWICRSCNKQNMNSNWEVYWLICTFNVFNCPLFCVAF